ncbi:hypothetical protein B0H14DRAFT_2557053 [Mycena olivaceomarginata]|nr:hypothetical protein B0H14DRAFT_2557053 [Mycena olivaceomarginata]
MARIVRPIRLSSVFRWMGRPSSLPSGDGTACWGDRSSGTRRDGCPSVRLTVLDRKWAQCASVAGDVRVAEFNRISFWQTRGYTLDNVDNGEGSARWDADGKYPKDISALIYPESL